MVVTVVATAAQVVSIVSMQQAVQLQAVQQQAAMLMAAMQQVELTHQVDLQAVVPEVTHPAELAALPAMLPVQPWV